MVLTSTNTHHKEADTMKKAVLCIVQNQNHAELIVGQLQNAGFSNDDISVLFPTTSSTRDFAHEHHTKAPEGAVAGAGAGGVVGGTLGLLLGTGALAIPGLGVFIAAGPLLAALSGMAAGAAVGGIAGALVGMGIPEIEAKRYEGKITGGNILISVHTETRDELRRAETIFRAAHAEDICSTAEASIPLAS
jgi:outer membrane lipoprotein SlyB